MTNISLCTILKRIYVFITVIAMSVGNYGFGYSGAEHIDTKQSNCLVDDDSDSGDNSDDWNSDDFWSGDDDSEDDNDGDVTEPDGDEDNADNATPEIDDGTDNDEDDDSDGE